MLSFTLNLPAQDIQYSQFYANPMYLNPAFAGSAHATRFVLHQRIQWPALDAQYLSSSFSADSYFKNYNSGLGVIFLRDVQGTRTISTTEMGLAYSYELQISSRFSARLGLQGNYVSRYLNYNVLTFPDQYTDNGFTGNKTGEPFGKETVKFFDITTGGLFYSDNFWIGYAAHHINEPNQSFYGSVSRLPLKLAITGGYRLKLLQSRRTGEEDATILDITPTVHYKLQEKSDQFDAGVYALYYQTILGFWYRGIPFKQYDTDLQNNESMVFLAGYKYKNLSVSYSFDFTVSKLTRANTGGSHEVNLTYLLDWPPKRKKVMRRLPCPQFYK
jgi:type IX secretion system PorP/SprF family membrane protein